MLGLYSQPHEDYIFSTTDDLFYAPFSASIAGQTGGVIVKKIYLRNNHTDRSYSNIYVQPIASGDIDYVSSLWSWKLMAKDKIPSAEEWEQVTAAAALSLGSIGTSTEGDSATYLSFWVRVEVPGRQLAANITDIILRITAVEYLIS